MIVLASEPWCQQDLHNEQRHNGLFLHASHICWRQRCQVGSRQFGRFPVKDFTFLDIVKNEIFCHFWVWPTFFMSNFLFANKWLTWNPRILLWCRTIKKIAPRFYYVVAFVYYVNKNISVFEMASFLLSEIIASQSCLEHFKNIYNSNAGHSRVNECHSGI